MTQNLTGPSCRVIFWAVSTPILSLLAWKERREEKASPVGRKAKPRREEGRTEGEEERAALLSTRVSGRPLKFMVRRRHGSERVDVHWVSFVGFELISKGDIWTLSSWRILGVVESWATAKVRRKEIIGRRRR